MPLHAHTYLHVRTITLPGWAPVDRWQHLALTISHALTDGSILVGGVDVDCSCGLLGVQLPPGPSHLVALALAVGQGWRYVDRATPNFHRSHNPTCCEAVRKGCENQLVKAFEFEQDRG